MNAKGFATVLSLCLILVVALIVRGIHAAEGNHAYETTDARAEFDLQNAADSAVFEAAAQVLSGDVILPVNETPFNLSDRMRNQRRLVKRTITSAHAGTIAVEAWGERLRVHPYKVSYGGENETAFAGGNIAKKVKVNRKEQFLPAYVFFSVAQTTNEHTGGKIYRRAFAYALEGDATIRFMELPTKNYVYER